jgi:hypothetical protein
MYIWRPNRALDFKDPDVIFEVKRLKKVSWYSSRYKSITLIIRDQRYYFNGPFTLFDKIRNGTDKIENEEPIIKLEH